MTAPLPELFEADPLVRLSPWASSEYCASLNLLVLVPSREQINPTVHELSHFFEHAVTPFGFFRDEMHRRQILLFQELMKRFPGNVPTPVYAWALRVLTAPASAPDPNILHLIDRYVRPWGACTRILQVLDGSREERLQATLADGELETLAVAESPLTLDSTEPTSTWTRNRIGIRGKQSTACPSWTWEDESTITFAAGALHVSEMIAQVQEGLGACMGCKDEWKYLALAFKIIECIGPAHFSQMQRHAKVTSLTLGDLALFTPIGSFYGRLRPEGSVWEDLHPGHRFERALAVVAEGDHWVSDFRDSEQLANVVSDKLGWPRPRAFLELGAANGHEAARRHREACQIRLADYMAFYDLARLGEEASPIGSFFGKHMPLTIHPKFGAVCCYPDGHTEPVVAIEQIRDYFVSRLSRRVMQFGYDPQERILPAELDLGTYMANVTSEHELAELYAEGHPWASPDRFVSLD